MKKLLQNILLFLAGLFFSLILAEIGIRVFSPQPKYYAPQYLFKVDELLGYKLTPNFKGFYSTPENIVKIRINSDGLRDYEHGEKRGARILGLGDSFVMGVGVELEETFLYLLEKHFNSNFEGFQLDVIKAGVQGYGTDQELSFYKTSGLTYRPDLVILGFYPNDLIDNLLPNFTVRNGYLTMEGEAITKIKKNRSLINYNYITGLLKNEIHLFRFITNNLGNIPFFKKIFMKAADKLKKSRRNRIAIYSKQYDKKLQEGWLVTKKNLKELKNEVRSNNSELLIVYIPERLQVYKEQWERVKKQWGLNDINYDKDRPNKILSDFCKESNIPFLDLSFEFIMHVEKGEEIYYQLDPHLTVNGNEVAAKVIYKKIIDDQLIKISEKSNAR